MKIKIKIDQDNNEYEVKVDGQVVANWKRVALNCDKEAEVVDFTLS